MSFRTPAAPVPQEPSRQDRKNHPATRPVDHRDGERRSGALSCSLRPRRSTSEKTRCLRSSSFFPKAGWVDSRFEGFGAESGEADPKMVNNCILDTFWRTDTFWIVLDCAGYGPPLLPRSCRPNLGPIHSVPRTQVRQTTRCFKAQTTTRPVVVVVVVCEVFYRYDWGDPGLTNGAFLATFGAASRTERSDRMLRTGWAGTPAPVFIPCSALMMGGRAAQQ